MLDQARNPISVVGIEIIFFNDNKDYPRFKNCDTATFILARSITVVELKKVVKTLSNGSTGSFQACLFYGDSNKVCKRKMQVSGRVLNGELY